MFLISDNIDTYTGMRLAGVEGVVVHTHDELKDALQKAISNKEIGIILLTEKFGREFPEIIDDVPVPSVTLFFRNLTVYRKLSHLFLLRKFQGIKGCIQFTDLVTLQFARIIDKTFYDDNPAVRTVHTGM